jgi:hypothetical protein
MCVNVNTTDATTVLRHCPLRRVCPGSPRNLLSFYRKADARSSDVGPARNTVRRQDGTTTKPRAEDKGRLRGDFTVRNRTVTPESPQEREPRLYRAAGADGPVH